MNESRPERLMATSAPALVAVATVLLVLSGAAGIYAQGFDLVDYDDLTPVSIPVLTGSQSEVIGMRRMIFNSNSGGNTSFSGITLQVTGTINETTVSEMSLLFEQGNPGSKFDRNETSILTVPNPFPSGKTQSFAIDPTGNSFTTAGDDYFLYVVFRFGSGSTAEVTETVGCEITQLWYGAAGVGGGTPGVDLPTISNLSLDPEYAAGGTGTIHNYEADFGAFGIAPTEATQGDPDVPVLRLEFDVTTDPSVSVLLDSIELESLGTADSDVASGGVILYEDHPTLGTSGELDANDIWIASTSLIGGIAVLTPVADLEIATGGTTYFVAVNVADVPSNIGHTIGFRILNPSSKIVFSDDPATDVGGISAVEYDQSGYITATGATPVTDRTFTVLELVLPDTTPPTVNVTIPTNGGMIDSLDSVIEIYWSEDVTGAGDSPVADEANFVFEDQSGDPVAFSLSYEVSGTQYITTITPDASLSYETIYQITVLSAGIADKATAPNGMEEDYSFLFGTGQQYPTVTEPTALNNRIVSGGNSQVVILIPEPPAGESDRMSVQVFTSTGKLVRTFYRNTAYSTISGSLPLLWDGTNGRGQPLGPGMYFVQIQATNFKRVLKVLIVR